MFDARADAIRKMDKNASDTRYVRLLPNTSLKGPQIRVPNPKPIKNMPTAIVSTTWLTPRSFAAWGRTALSIGAAAPTRNEMPDMIRVAQRRLAKGRFGGKGGP